MKYRLAPQNYEEWLKDRKDHPSIGASMSASILGFNPWQSAVDVWEQLVFGKDDKIDNLSMTLGRAMEPIVKKLFMERTGLKVKNDNKIRIDEEHEFITTNLDGMVVGENIPVEYKTTAKPWDGEIPNHYFVQLQHQMMVTESPSIYFCSLSMGFNKQLIVEKYDRNEDFIGELRDILVEFWHYNIMERVAPEPKSIEDAKKLFNTTDPDSQVTASTNVEIQIAELRALQTHKSDIDKRMNDGKLEIMKVLGEKEELIDVNEDVLVTWKKSKDTQVFDKKKFAEEQPDIYNKYLINRDGSRRFVVKKRDK